MPTAPGLGIELREDVLARYAYREFPARTSPRRATRGRSAAVAGASGAAAAAPVPDLRGVLAIVAGAGTVQEIPPGGRPCSKSGSGSALAAATKARCEASSSATMSATFTPDCCSTKRAFQVSKSS